MQIVVPAEHDSQPEGFLLREGEKKMGAEISVGGTKDPLLPPGASLPLF